MDKHSVTKENLLVTLRNVSIELYAIEEALLHARQELPQMAKLKEALQEVHQEIDRLNLPGPIEFEAPTPSRSLLVRGNPRSVRKNMCTY